MDFIERWLQISPDGGSGNAEALCLLLAAIGVAIAYRRELRGVARLGQKLRRAIHRIALSLGS
jgi:hypothetical protein